MTYQGAMDQDRIFYTREWTREIDDLFIRGLCEQTVAGNVIRRGNANRRAIMYCRDRVNGEFATTFDYDTCLDRFRKLYKHYEVFHYITEHAGVQHHPAHHAVQATEKTWDDICMVHTLAFAYMRRGEEQYENLRFIFNAIPEAPANGDEMVEVVQISSDNESMSVNNEVEKVDVEVGNAFNYELAWYTSGGSTNTLNASAQTFSGMSSSSKPHGKFRHVSASGSGARRSSLPSNPGPPASGPSSVASSSPFKN
ncbi:hypothetical protein ACS0TY_025016 [Phlomoides rotata]